MERERELFVHTPVACSPVTYEWDLRPVHAILEQEFISRGGNIRDITTTQLQDFISSGGQVWAAHREGEPLAVCTIQPMMGLQPWLYINNGVVVPSERHKQSGMMDGLLAETLAANGWTKHYFVISVVAGIFTRLGFNEVVPETLDAIDPIIAHIVRGKLRPGKESHIFIRIPRS